MNRFFVLIFCMVFILPVYFIGHSRLNTAKHSDIFALDCNGAIVYLNGNIEHQGVYCLADKKMTDSAIEMATGRRPSELTSLNDLKAVGLEDGSSLKLSLTDDKTVHFKVERLATAKRILLDIPLDINSMLIGDFERLPGIGPVLAAAIIEYRQNNGDSISPDDLMMVSGIGPKKFKAIRGYFK